MQGKPVPPVIQKYADTQIEWLFLNQGSRLRLIKYAQLIHPDCSCIEYWHSYHTLLAHDLANILYKHQSTRAIPPEY